MKNTFPFTYVHKRVVGEDAPDTRLFHPVDRFILSADEPLAFDLYASNASKRGLDHILPEGREISKRLLTSIRSPRCNRVFFVRADQRRALLRYKKHHVQEVLNDATVPTENKCAVMRDLTSMQTIDLLEKPSAENIRQHKENIAQMVDFTISEPISMRHMLQLTHHDYYTYTHSVNVGIYATAVALRYLGNGQSHDLHQVAAGFFLHDIGKCKVPSEIINKKGRLNEEEWEEIRRHPDHGCAILRSNHGMTPEIAIIVGQHHEKMDGQGYPLGLMNDEIHVYSRICSVADAFDALTTKRSYKDAMHSYQALRVMREEMHRQFDSDIFKMFVQLMCPVA